MKKIMMAAVAATFMSTGAQAESFSESCGHLDNPTRFNPTELSAYQECWLDYHKPDEMAGVLGSIFYARAGDSIVSMPVSDLRSAGSAGAAQAIVVERIVEVINNERVEELEGIVEGLEATVSEKNAVIAALEAAGVTDGATIERLMMEKAAVEGALSALRGAVDGAGTSEIRVTRNGDMVAVDFVNRAAIAAEGDDTAYRNGQLSVGAQSVAQDGRIIRVRLTNRSETWTFRDAIDLTGDNEAARDAHGAAIATQVSSDNNDVSATYDAASNMLMITNNANTSHEVTVNGVVHTITADATINVDITTDNEAARDARGADIATQVTNDNNDVTASYDAATDMLTITNNANTSHVVTVNGTPHTVTADTTITVDITSDNAGAITAARMAVDLNPVVHTDVVGNDTRMADATGLQLRDWQISNMNSHTFSNTHAAYSSTVSDYNGFSGNVFSIRVNGVTYSGPMGSSFTASMYPAIAAAVDATYSAGFSDGYDEGYADGYRDGFADGVDSVGR